MLYRGRESNNNYDGYYADSSADIPEESGCSTTLFFVQNRESVEQPESIDRKWYYY